MMTALIIFTVVLVLTIVAHFLFWRDSKKRYENFYKEVVTLKSSLQSLLDGYDAIEKEMGEAENAMQRLDAEIEFGQKMHQVLLALNNKISSLEN